MNKDEAKGRVKEAAGDLTDDKGAPKREGKPRAAGARPRCRLRRRQDQGRRTDMN